MKAPLDPPRLIDSADADPALRNALRAIQEVPSALALGKMADGAARAVREAAAVKGAAATASLAAKLVIATVAGGALAYIALPAVRSPNAGRLPDAPSSSAVAASVPTMPAAGPSGHPKNKAPVEARAVTAPNTEAPESPAAAAPGPAKGAAMSRGVASAAHTTESASRARTTAMAEPPAPAAESATSEMDLLEEAQEALSHEPRRSLELLAQHRATYPRSKFGQERDVLKLEALQRLHDTAALEAGARVFLERYPHSPHRARLNKLLEGLHLR